MASPRQLLVVREFRELLSSYGGRASDKPRDKHIEELKAVKYEMALKRIILTDPYYGSVSKHEECAVLAIREHLGWSDIPSTEKSTIKELQKLRELMRDYPSEISFSVPEGPDDHDVHAGTISSAVSAHPTSRYRPTVRLNHLRGKAMPTDNDEESGGVPKRSSATQQSPSSEPQNDLQPQNASQKTELRNDELKIIARSILIWFDEQELAEIRPWTALSDDAVRSFLRSAIGNHIFIQKYEAHGEFLLRFIGSDGKPTSNVLRKVRFK